MKENNILFYRVIFTFAFVVILLNSSYLSANTDNWEFSMELSKQSYNEYEPIWVDFYLINISADTIRTDGIVAPNHFRYFVDLKNSKGESLKYTGENYLFASGPGHLSIEAGEEVYACFDVLELFGIRNSISKFSTFNLFFPYLPPDRYTIQGHFEDYSTNEVSFDIIEPEGEEKDALDLLIESCQSWKRNDTEPSQIKFESFEQLYQNSVYSEMNFFLMRIFSGSNHELFKQGLLDKKSLHEDMLSRYPNSGNTKGWINALVKNMSEDEKIEFYNNIIKKYLNTRVYKFAIQGLKKMEREEKE